MSNGLLSESGLTLSGTPWMKRAAIVVLFVLGLVFWIPPLLRATVGESVLGSASEPASAATEQPVTSESSIPSESPKSQPLDSRQLTADRCDADRIVLSGTILGKSRRAAILNGRLYREGDHLRTGGHSYYLARVAEDRVELSRESKNSQCGSILVIRVDWQRSAVNAPSTDRSQSQNRKP